MSDQLTAEREREREREGNIAIEVHGVARDARDVHTDSITAQLVAMVANLQNKMLDHMADEGRTIKNLTDGLTRVETSVATFIGAFPGGDAISHRRRHEDFISADNDKKRFWVTVKTALVVSGAVAIAIWVGVVLWKAFLIGPKG